mmetsp:Transcript_23085/g.55184  ORF Transcript_23085/g.55184 Transcript_23085/m.55184 type:complete len:166 (+) Transcript_23085:108-605(+)
MKGSEERLVDGRQRPMEKLSAMFCAHPALYLFVFFESSLVACWFLAHHLAERKIIPLFVQAPVLSERAQCTHTIAFIFLQVVLFAVEYDRVRRCAAAACKQAAADGEKAAAARRRSMEEELEHVRWSQGPRLEGTSPSSPHGEQPSTSVAAARVQEESARGAQPS